MMKKEYSNGEVVVVWKPEKCIHAGVCVKMLPKVYVPNAKPWINAENATEDELRAQVSKCPSGALSIKDSPDDPIIVQDDDGKKGRFVLKINEEVAGLMTYTWAGDTKFIIDHTEVNKEYAGKNFGVKLVLAAVDFARDKKVMIMPLCPFAAKVFSKYDRIQDVEF